MTNPTRTRAEIQAEIEKRQAEIEKLKQEWKDAWPKEGHAVWLKAYVHQLDEDTVDVKVVGDRGGICAVSYPALIPAADIIPREEAVAYLVNEYQMDVSPMDESPAPRIYTHIGDDMREYRVTVERVSGVAESESEKSDE